MRDDSARHRQPRALQPHESNPLLQPMSPPAFNSRTHGCWSTGVVRRPFRTFSTSLPPAVAQKRPDSAMATRRVMVNMLTAEPASKGRGLEVIEATAGGRGGDRVGCSRQSDHCIVVLLLV